MPSIGIRELKARASEVIREVRLSGGEIASPITASKRSAAVWSTIDQIAREIGRRWPKGVSAVQAVREGRREL